MNRNAQGHAKLPFALELVDVRKCFGKTEVIVGATMRVKEGERVAVIGPNGAGKSTLFDLISGRTALGSGEIRLHGERTDGLRPFDICRKGLARSFQVSNLFLNLSVFDNLRCAVLWSLGYRYAFWKFLSRLRDANERAEQVMKQVRLGKQRDVLAMHLPYAGQRALEVGLTIAGGADVLLLDEPTAGMGRAQAQEFVELIREISVGRTLVMVEHDMDVVFGLADRIAVLARGQVIAFDTPDAVRADPRVQEAYLGAMPARRPAERVA